MLLTAQPTPLATPVTVGGRPAQSTHTATPAAPHQGFMCGQEPVFKRDCRARATGEAHPALVGGRNAQGRARAAAWHAAWSDLYGAVRGESLYDRPRGLPASLPPATLHARAVLPTHRPVLPTHRVPRHTPRARTGRPHPPAPARTARTPRQPAPARPLQRARRKAPMAHRDQAWIVFFVRLDADSRQLTSSTFLLLCARKRCQRMARFRSARLEGGRRGRPSRSALRAKGGVSSAGGGGSSVFPRGRSSPLWPRPPQCLRLPLG